MVLMLKPGRLLPAPKEPRQSANTLFNVLCVTGLGSLPTLFILLMCAALFIKHLRQFGFCRLLDPREQLSGHLYSATGHVQRVGRDTIRFTYLSFQKDYSHQGQWCAFQFTKVTTASPHTTQGYQTCTASD